MHQHILPDNTYHETYFQITIRPDTVYRPTSHYLKQWWPSSKTHICVTQPQWANFQAMAYIRKRTVSSTPEDPNTSDSNIDGRHFIASNPQLFQKYYTKHLHILATFQWHKHDFGKKKSGFYQNVFRTSHLQTVFLNILERLEDLPSSCVSLCYSRGNWEKKHQ